MLWTENCVYKYKSYSYNLLSLPTSLNINTKSYNKEKLGFQIHICKLNRFSSYDTRFNGCIDLCLKLSSLCIFCIRSYKTGVWPKQKFAQLNYKVYIQIWVKIWNASLDVHSPIPQTWKFYAYIINVLIIIMIDWNNVIKIL